MVEPVFTSHNMKRASITMYAVLVCAVLAVVGGVLVAPPANSPEPPGGDPLARLAAAELAVAALQEQLDQLAQDALVADIELENVPRLDRENTTQVLVRLAAGWGVPLGARDVVLAAREGRSKPRLVARLATRALRDQLIYAAGQSMLRAPDNKHPVRAVERLTARRRRVLRAARAAAARHGWRYAGARGGRVYVREGEHSPPRWLRSEKDLLTLLSPAPPAPQGNQL